MALVNSLVNINCILIHQRDTKNPSNWHKPSSFLSQLKRQHLEFPSNQVFGMSWSSMLHSVLHWQVFE